MAAMTVRGIDDAMAKLLKEKASEQGISVNRLVLNLLKESLKLRARRRGGVYEDLDHLAGTWDESDAAEFEKNTAVFSQVDEELWK